MIEKEIYENSIIQIKNNNLTEAFLLLKESKSYQNQELLALIYCLFGDFYKSKLICHKLLEIKDNSKIKTWLNFLDNNIKNDYIPIFNTMILDLKSETYENIENYIQKLENISPNTQIYTIAILYYLSLKKIKKAHVYLNKLKALDIENINYIKLEKYFKKNNFKLISVLLLAGIGISTLFLFNINSKNKILEEKISNQNNLLSKKEKIELNLNLKINELEKENYELNSKSKIVKIEKIIVENNKKDNINSTKEYFNWAAFDYKRSKYKKALNELKNVNLEKLNIIQQAETLFLLAKCYEKINNYEQALKYYKKYDEFYKIHKNKLHSNYINDCIYSIKKLG